MTLIQRPESQQDIFAAWKGCPAQVVIKEGWEGAGRVGYTVGPLEVKVCGQKWTPVLWNGEEDPDWHKTAGLRLVPCGKEARAIAQKDAKSRHGEVFGEEEDT